MRGGGGGGRKGATGVVMKGCAGNLECGERESECFASPVWQSSSGLVPIWAASPRGGSVWPALTGGRLEEEEEAP